MSKSSNRAAIRMRVGEALPSPIELCHAKEMDALDRVKRRNVESDAYKENHEEIQTYMCARRLDSSPHVFLLLTKIGCVSMRTSLEREAGVAPCIANCTGTEHTIDTICLCAEESKLLPVSLVIMSKLSEVLA